MKIRVLSAALLLAGSAHAAQPDYPAQLTWSTVTQSNNGGAWCEGINTSFPDDGRFDVTIPAHGGSPAVTVPITPESQDIPSYGYSASDGPTVVTAGIVADNRVRALVALMELHERCAAGGTAARDGCIPFGRIAPAMEALFKNPNTGADFTPDTYTAPRAQFPSGSGLVWKFTQPDHLFDYHIMGGTTTLRQRLLQGAAKDDPYKWVVYDTPGYMTTCAECRETYSSSAGYDQGMVGDRATRTPAQAAAFEAIILAPLQADEYTIGPDGGVVVPYCPEQ